MSSIGGFIGMFCMIIVLQTVFAVLFARSCALAQIVVSPSWEMFSV